LTHFSLLWAGVSSSRGLLKIFTSSSSEEDSEEEDEEEDEESESELLSLSELESEVVFFLAGGLAFFFLPSDESDEPEESESDSEAAALPLVWTGVD
jgi:hypothetical protein